MCERRIAVINVAYNTVQGQQHYKVAVIQDKAPQDNNYQQLLATFIPISKYILDKDYFASIVSAKQSVLYLPRPGETYRDLAAYSMPYMVRVIPVQLYLYIYISESLNILKSQVILEFEPQILKKGLSTCKATAVGGGV